MLSFVYTAPPQKKESKSCSGGKVGWFLNRVGGIVVGVGQEKEGELWDRIGILLT